MPACVTHRLKHRLNVGKLDFDIAALTKIGLYGFRDGVPVALGHQRQLGKQCASLAKRRRRRLAAGETLGLEAGVQVAGHGVSLMVPSVEG